jgi:hypothetical protein
MISLILVDNNTVWIKIISNEYNNENISTWSVKYLYMKISLNEYWHPKKKKGID